MIPGFKKDKIYNALITGMALEDAYIYAGLSPAEIEAVSEDEELQREFHEQIKSFEFVLLNRINDISQKQVRMGKEAATTWMLEHMFPRYSGKPQAEGGQVHLHFADSDPAKLDTVEVFKSNE